MPLSKVAVGTYDVGKYKSIGSKDQQDKELEKLRNYQYNAFKQY